jgi:hypothetical protein
VSDVQQVVAPREYVPTMADDGMLDFEFGTRHPHLPLSAALSAGDRRRVPRGFGRARQYTDRKSHAENLRSQVAAITSDYQARSPVLGIEPKLVMTIRLNRAIEPGEFARAGIQILNMSQDLVVIAFADDPSLATFTERCERYEAGRPDEPTSGGDERAAPLEGFFDAIDSAESWIPTDCVTEAARALLAQAGNDHILRLDLQCWCPEGRTDAEQLRNQVIGAVTSREGTVLDKYLNERAGLSLLRIDLAAAAVFELAATGHLHRLDVLPSPRLGLREVRHYPATGLPTMLEPAADAPVVAIIDSGIRSAHPLLARAVIGVEALSGEIADGEDRTGHGTHVASIALYGSIEDLLNGTSAQPDGKLLSIRVLNDNDEFPSAHLWESDLTEAIRYAAQQGAKVVNLSLADPRTPYSGTRPTPVAAILDQLSHELDLVIVVSVGNTSPTDYVPHDEIITDYLHSQLSDMSKRILEPAPAALALTVGGICADLAQGAAAQTDSARSMPLGQPGWPSPTTRSGPGISGMIKPELVAPSGTYNYDAELQRFGEGVGVLGADAESPDRLLGSRIGVSHAAPVVSNAVLRTASVYPEASSNLLRALVLQSATRVDVPVDMGTPAKTRAASMQLVGYGRPEVSRSLFSTDHRAVLVAEDKIPVDSVHIYRIPIPSSFRESGGWRTITVSLSYDPQVRVTRLDYLASRMQFALYRGTSLEEVEREYLKELESDEDPALPEDLDVGEEAEGADDEEDNVGPESIRKYLLGLQPSSTARSRGANQYAFRHFPQRFKDEYGDDMFLVVRNINRWETPATEQSYAVVVALEREPGRTPIYAELAAELTAEVELEVENEITLET